MTTEVPNVHIELRIELLSPLSGADSDQASVAGSALRGALAAHYLQTGDASDDLFKDMFLDGTTWPNLYLWVNRATRPVPLSAVTCSRFPGFLGASAGIAGYRPHGVDDALLTPEAARIASRPALWSDRQRCPVCIRQRQPTPLTGLPGYVERIEPGSYAMRRPARENVIGAPMERLMGRTDGARAYARQTLSAGVTMGGCLATSAATAPALRDMLSVGREFRLGGGRSRGLGLVRIAFCGEPEAPVTPLSERLESLRARLVALVGNADLLGGWRYASVTLQSDALLVDDFLRYRDVVVPEDVGSAALEARQRFAATDLIGGWNAAAGLPKEQGVAVRRGSAFLYRYREDDHDAVVEALDRIERTGIGERRAEGFGSVSVGDPFHWEVHELWQS